MFNFTRYVENQLIKIGSYKPLKSTFVIDQFEEIDKKGLVIEDNVIGIKYPNKNNERVTHPRITGYFLYVITERYYELGYDHKETSPTPSEAPDIYYFQSKMKEWQNSAFTHYFGCMADANYTRRNELFADMKKWYVYAIPQNTIREGNHRMREYY